MRIEFLEGYKNGFNKEDNSVTLRINTGPLKQYLNEVINNENIYNIMSRLTKEYKHITFPHTFRLGHANREYNQLVTNHRGALYQTSNEYEANGDNLQDQLQKSLMSLFDELTYLGNDGSEGVHYINIMMKKNDTIVDIEYDERGKIRTTHKKTATGGYMFNDDTDDDTEKNNLFETKTKKGNNKPSANKNSRCNNSTIQYGGCSHFKQSNHILMDEINLNNLKNLSKSELINLVLKQQKSKIIVEDKTKPSPKPMRPVPTPRKYVKSMVQQYEDNVISPPPQFRDDYKPIPLPRTKKPLQAPIPTPRTKKPSEKRTIISQVEKALKGYTQSFDVELRDKTDPLLQLQKSRRAVEYLFNNLLVQTKGFKFVETLQVKFFKQSNDKNILKNGYFNSTTDLIINETDIKLAIQDSQQQILNKIAQWISEGSGWTIQSIENHYINIVNYSPLKGSSYIKLPQELWHSAKGLINMKNKDNECFRWCHIRHLNPQDKDPQRIKKTDKQYIEKLDYSSIEFPVTVKQINKIEKQNNICINLFGYEEKQKFPIYISKEKYQDHMELLLITEGENKHYVLIKDFNKFMFSQTKHEHKKYFCMYCLQCFSREDVLTEHKNNCILINGKQAINMPKKGDKVFFKNYHKQLPVPFVIYADFEALTEKIQGCQPNNEKSYTEAYQKHTDCGYGYKVVCCYDDKYSKPVQIHRGENAVHKFMENMLEEVNWCKSIMKKHFNKPLEMTKENEIDFQKATKCHICDQQYTDKDIRVRDHCHITGEFCGSAHQDCNLKLRIKPATIKIPVLFHNLRGYDSHFIMQQIGEIAKKHAYKNKRGEECHMNINCIPNNMEKYMTFMLGNHLVFLDSFQFMSSSLDNLVKNLPDEAFKYTKHEFKKEQFNLMKQKGIYPYDHMDCFDRFNESQLPKKQDFYSILNNEHISDEQYKHAQNVWDTFNLKTMGDYHDLYLKSDILLLADLFENFRKTCLQYYKLDPCHYFTSPGLSWDAMLKMTNIKLELMTDIDMFQFIEKGMRGGTSYIANRYGKANNKYMKNYDEKAPTKYIMYLDANNLYGWAMSQYLPTGNFKWLSQNQIEKTNLGKYTENSKKGLILEVDLEYPQELHDLHNDYPLGPEKIKVAKDMLSDYCKKIADKFNISSGLVHKLIPTLNDKEKYILHYHNLQSYLSLGLKLKKIHRVLQFDQSPWLKQYIDFNTQKRTHAKNSFEKDFFKLMNNSVFGKTMENIRKRVDVRLVTSKEKLLKLASKPTYVSSKIFNENLVAVHKIKETLTMNRPAHIGMCILDLSKTLMYQFHYNYIKQHYGSNAKLLFTDTDSLTYEIETDDAYADFWKNKDKFDNSDYNKESPFYNAVNKNVIGKFKDESAGIPITEFVGLRSKMYSYVKDNEQTARTAKGNKKQVIIKDNKHEDYKNVLFNNEQIHHKMKTIRSEKHQLGSYELNKISLSCFDDKRFIHENGITSYAYGHYEI